MTLDLIPTAEKSFVAAVAERASVTEEVAGGTLDRFGLVEPAPPRRPHRLDVHLVHFAGVKITDEAPGTPTPFGFTWRLGPGAWAITSTDRNLAGKSSVLEIIRWCLRGRPHVQNDVAEWLRRVILLFHVDDDAHAIAFEAADGSPAGALYQVPDAAAVAEAVPEGPYEQDGPTAASVLEEAGGAPIARFRSGREMEQVLDVFMLDRLELQRIPRWQNRPGATQEDLDAVEGQLKWTTYSGALAVLDPSSSAVLGDEPRVATRLLQMFLGSPWAPLSVHAQTRRRDVEQQIGRLNRRISAEAAAGERADDQLHDRLREAQSQLRELVASETEPTVDPADLAAAVARAAQAAAQAAGDLASAIAEHEAAQRRADDAVSDLVALRENQLARRFFHSIQPISCPRCDAGIGADRQARENEGQCSVCDEPLDLADVETANAVTDGDEDSLSPLDLSQERADELQARALEAAEHVGAARQRDEVAQTELQAARAAMAAMDADAARRRRDLELQVAHLEGAVQERTAVAGRISDDPAVTALEADAVVLKAAETVATARRDDEQRGWLQEVSREVLELAVRFGIGNLETVEVRGNAQIRLRKGGQADTFSGVTPGERVRLKIALVVALLRVGAHTGMGRHPGLILIDGPGTEEMTDDNLRELLRQVVAVTDEVSGLQVLIAESRGPLVAEVVPGDRVRAADPGKSVW